MDKFENYVQINEKHNNFNELQSKNKINCDQVSWLLNIADRYISNPGVPGACRQRELKKYAMLYEIMDIARLDFADDSARWNGTPNSARKYTE